MDKVKGVIKLLAKQVIFSVNVGNLAVNRSEHFLNSEDTGGKVKSLLRFYLKEKIRLAGIAEYYN